MTTNEILSLYNIGKDIISKSSASSNINDIIGIQRLYLSGKDAYIYDSSMGLNLYNYVLFNESVEEVKETMKINLELQEPVLIKEFSFDITENYEEKVIGKMLTGTTIYYEQKKVEEVKEDVKNNEEEVEEDEEEETIKVPNFVGLTYKAALNKAKELGLYLNVPSDILDTSIVINQDTLAGREVKVGVTIKLTFDTKEEVEEKKDDNEEENNSQNSNEEENNSEDSNEEKNDSEDSNEKQYNVELE